MQNQRRRPSIQVYTSDETEIGIRQLQHFLTPSTPIGSGSLSSSSEESHDEPENEDDEDEDDGLGDPAGVDGGVESTRFGLYKGSLNK